MAKKTGHGKIQTWQKGLSMAKFTHGEKDWVR